MRGALPVASPDGLGARAGEVTVCWNSDLPDFTVLTKFSKLSRPFALIDAA